MAAPRKYDREFRERAVRMYRDRLAWIFQGCDRGDPLSHGLAF
jgi:transposase-like protein